MGWFRICLILMLLMTLQSLIGAITPRQPIGTSIVADWVYAKCGTSGKQLWKYEGALFDPLDGRRIASVEGLEWVSLRTQNETTDRPIYSQVLNHPNATWTTAASMWSRHLFCYTVGDETNRTLLQTIRIRPYSPDKKIPLEQAAAVYDTTTTFIQRPDGQVVVHSEWPAQVQNQTISVWGVATTQRNPQEGTLGFSVYCKRRSPKSPLFLPDLTKQENQNPTNSNISALVVSPKRSQWVQFGISNMESKERFGARETYSIILPESKTPAQNFIRLPWISRSIPPAKPTLQYTRYGEGPPFYAPGRMCMLELHATPITDLDQASPIVQHLLHTRVQGWNAPLGGLNLLPEEGHKTQWMQYKGKALAVWERARSVSNVVSFFRKEQGYWSGGG